MKALKFEDYEITKDGLIINKKTNRILKTYVNNRGYKKITICGKKYFVHRLVAEKYVPNLEKKPCVNHKDGNKKNNNFSNLEWVNYHENTLHALNNDLILIGEKCSWSKLKEKDVIFIRESLLSNKELSILFNVSVRTISGIKKFNSWKQLKRYAELSQNEVIEVNDKKL